MFPSEFGLGFIFRYNDPRSSYTFGVWPVEFGALRMFVCEFLFKEQ